MKSTLTSPKSTKDRLIIKVCRTLGERILAHRSRTDETLRENGRHGKRCSTCVPYSSTEPAINHKAPSRPTHVLGKKNSDATRRGGHEVGDKGMGIREPRQVPAASTGSARVGGRWSMVEDQVG